MEDNREEMLKENFKILEEGNLVLEKAKKLIDALENDEGKGE